MTDILKDTPAYHWMTDDAREEGIERGREQERRAAQIAIMEERQAAQAALLERLRGIFLASMAARFPKSVRSVKKLISDIEDIDQLSSLIIRVNTAQNADDVKQYLLDFDEEELVTL